MSQLTDDQRQREKVVDSARAYIDLQTDENDGTVPPTERVFLAGIVLMLGGANYRE